MDAVDECFEFFPGAHRGDFIPRFQRIYFAFNCSGNGLAVVGGKLWQFDY